MDALTPHNFRMIDASLNRAAEGLRFLEDVARFLLNDPVLTKRLKLLRHSLLVSDWHFQKQLLEFRDAVGDVGLGTDIPTEKENKRDLLSSIVANSRRAQEALRSLEELSKVSSFSIHLNANKLEQARFNLYTIEKELAGRLLRRDKANRLHGIYVIIDIQALNGRNHLDVALQAINGGASVIQLRDKMLDHGKLLSIARELNGLCSEKNVLYIINDYIDIAMAVQADGIHLGQTDLPIAIARKLMPIDQIIGCSTDTVTQAKQAVAKGADYVAVGAIFPTPSKKTEVIGLKTLSKIKQAVPVPVVAIGGINKTNIAEVKLAGADAAAVISAVMGAASPEKVVKELTRKFEVVE